MKTSALLLSLCLLASPAYSREWTNTSGQKIQAEFMALSGADGAEVVKLKMAGGKTYDVPLAQLSEADQTFAKAQSKPAAETAAPAAESTPSVFQDMLKGKLVAVDGKRVKKYEAETTPKFYAFYFSASWCGPCKAFTPELVKFYNASEGKKKNFEIVFVSKDNDEKSMEEYMKADAMPWPAISFRNVARMSKITAYAGSGIPCLVLVDSEGNVVSDSYEGKDYVGPNKVMNEIEEKTAPAQ